VRALIGVSYAHLIRGLAGDVFPGKIDILGRAGMQVRRQIVMFLVFVLALALAQRLVSNRADHMT
jgi:hypothetical protein